MTEPAMFPKTLLYEYEVEGETVYITTTITMGDGRTTTATAGVPIDVVLTTIAPQMMAVVEEVRESVVVVPQNVAELDP